MQVENAIIESALISIERGFVLSARLFLDYGGSGQGFGGHCLYLGKEATHHDGQKNFAGHFIFRCMQIAGVKEWKNLPGKTIRVNHDHSTVHSIGHIVKNDWFCPSEEFENLK